MSSIRYRRVAFALLSFLVAAAVLPPLAGAAETERKQLVNDLEKIVLENAYYIQGLWWTRNVVHWAKVKNYVAPPNHYSNQKLQDVWLAAD